MLSGYAQGSILDGVGGVMEILGGITGSKD